MRDINKKKFNHRTFVGVLFATVLFFSLGPLAVFAEVGGTVSFATQPSKGIVNNANATLVNSWENPMDPDYNGGDNNQGNNGPPTNNRPPDNPNPGDNNQGNNPGDNNPGDKDDSHGFVNDDDPSDGGSSGGSDGGGSDGGSSSSDGGGSDGGSSDSGGSDSGSKKPGDDGDGPTITLFEDGGSATDGLVKMRDGLNKFFGQFKYIKLFGGQGVWALVNLILAIIGFILAIMSACSFGKKLRRMVFLILTIVVGIAGLIIFFLTEDMTRQVVLVDSWTILTAVIFIVEVIFYNLSFRNRSNV